MSLYTGTPNPAPACPSLCRLIGTVYFVRNCILIMRICYCMWLVAKMHEFECFIRKNLAPATCDFRQCSIYWKSLEIITDKCAELKIKAQTKGEICTKTEGRKNRS